MEVGLKVSKQDMKGGEKQQILKAYFVFVAIDNSGRPVPVPEIKPASKDERKRFEAAESRKTARDKRN